MPVIWVSASVVLRTKRTFTQDLGADWLDRLELMMVIEDQFAGVEIADADVDQIEVVGDLIRYIETVGTR